MMKNILSQVTVEPAVFLYSFVLFIYSAAVRTLVQQKVCSPEVLPSIDFVCNDTVLLSEATDIVTTRSTWRETLPIFVCLLAGVWRDTTFRNKPLLYLSLTGVITGICIELFSIFYWTIPPRIFSITEGIISGLTGGNKLFFIGATFVVTDNSSEDERTSRITFLIATLTAGGTLATALSGYCLSFLGYKWFFIFLICLCLIAMIFIMFFVKDKETKKIKEGISWQSIRNFKSIFKSRPNHSVIWLMIIGSCIQTTSFIAQSNLFFYFLEQRFGFTVEEAGVYMSYRQIMNVLSSTIMPHIFTKFLKWSDFKVGMVCSLICVCSDITMAFARTRLELIMFGTLDFLRIFLFTVPKSIITKCVRSNEIGIFLSFTTIGECILPFAVFRVYVFIYSYTAKELQGAFFLVSASFIILVLIFFCISSSLYHPSENNCSDLNEGSDDFENKEFDRRSKKLEKDIDEDQSK